MTLATPSLFFQKVPSEIIFAAKEKARHPVKGDRLAR